MDLSLFERAFALRDEARKARLGDSAPDLSKLVRGVERRDTVDPAGLLESEVALDLMTRASALLGQANRAAGKTDTSSRKAMAQLLRAASARLPRLKSADMTTPQPARADSPDRKVAKAGSASRTRNAKAAAKEKPRVSPGKKARKKKTSARKTPPRRPR
jgi:hypothetical protein